MGKEKDRGRRTEDSFEFWVIERKNFGAELAETRLPLQGTSGQVTEIVIEPRRREGR